MNPPANETRRQIANVLQNSGIVFVWGVIPKSLPWLNAWLPARLEVRTRAASSLPPGAFSPVTVGLKPSDLYFCDQQPSEITTLALGGPLIEQSSVLLKDCDTDWLKWNNQPEYAKTAMIFRSEQEAKPPGAVLAEKSIGSGRLLLTTLSSIPRSLKAERINRTVLENLGLTLKHGMDSGKPLLKTGALVRALVCGFFFPTPAAGQAQSDASEAWQGNSFRTGAPMADKKWQPVFNESGVFGITEMNLTGSAQNATAYLSFWIESPYSLADLLLQPNLPQVDFQFTTSGSARLWLNNQQVLSDQGNRGASVAKALKLKAGWNHFLVKLTRSTDRLEFRASFAASQPDFLSQLDSALERP